MATNMRELIGETVGGYVLHDIIDFSSIYRYRATDLNGQRVLLELMLPLQDDEDVALQHVNARIQVLQQLLNPFILPLMDAGESRGFYYFVYPMSEGGTLNTLLADTIPPPEIALRLIQQLAVGLAHAHEQGTIHGNLCPEAIWMNQQGHISIMDFGVSDNPAIPYCRAPEQINKESVSSLIDVYALGIVSFWLFTGSYPFTHRMAYTINQMHLKQPPPDITNFNSTLPATLNAIFHKVLAKQPDERYHNTWQFFMALSEALDIPPAEFETGTQPQQVQPTPSEGAEDTPLSSRTIISLIGLAIGGVAIVIWAVWALMGL